MVQKESRVDVERTVRSPCSSPMGEMKAAWTGVTMAVSERSRNEIGRCFRRRHSSF